MSKRDQETTPETGVEYKNGPQPPMRLGAPVGIIGLALLLSLIGIICAASTNADNFRSWWVQVGVDIDGLDIGPDNAGDQQVDWILASSFLSVLFILIGWLNIKHAMETSYAFGIGFFFAIQGFLLVWGDQYAQLRRNLPEPSLAEQVSTAETLAAGYILMYIAGILALIAFVAGPKEEVRYPEDKLDRKPNRSLFVGLAALVFLIDFIGSIVLFVYSQQRAVNPVGQDRIVAHVSVNTIGQNEDVSVMPYASIAMLQAFWFLFTALKDDKCFTHANAAWAGYFLYPIGILAIQQEANEWRTGDNGNIDSTSYGLKMTGWGMIFLAQILLIIVAIVQGPLYPIWESERISIQGRKDDDKDLEFDYHSEVDEVSPETTSASSKKQNYKPRRGFGGTWRAFVAAAFTAIALVGAIIVWSKDQGAAANFTVALAPVAGLLFTIGIWTGRHTASVSGFGVALAISGRLVRVINGLYELNNRTVPGIPTSQELDLARTLAAGYGLAFLFVWFIPFLYIYPKQFAKIKPTAWVGVVLAILLTIGLIVAWASDLEGNNLADFPTNIGPNRQGVPAYPHTGAESGFFFTIETFFVGYLVAWALIGDHCPTLCAAMLFLGWELFNIVFTTIGLWDKWNLNRDGSQDTLDWNTGEQDMAVGGLIFAAIIMFIIWIFVIIMGPDCRPEAPPRKPIKATEHYTYTPGYYSGESYGRSYGYGYGYYY